MMPIFQFQQQSSVAHHDFDTLLFLLRPTVQLLCALPEKHSNSNKSKILLMTLLMTP